MIKKFLKDLLRKRIYSLLLSDSVEKRSEFISNYLGSNQEYQYDVFRSKYDIDNTFRFNGGDILFYGEGRIICGKNSYMGHLSMIQSYTDCKVYIGEGCSISSNVRIFTQTNISDQDFSNNSRKIKTGDVVIEDFVWIGANVVINPGIKIGRNSIVGANSVVSKDIPANEIHGGVPAKLIRVKSFIH